MNIALEPGPVPSVDPAVCRDGEANDPWQGGALLPGFDGGRLIRQRAAILIVLGLALLGGICGWLLRDQLVKRGNQMLEQSTSQQES
jgi:hypothetical protein